MFWDFHVVPPESIHALMFLFSDRGTPASLRSVKGYSGHTYKFTKKDGSYHYVTTSRKPSASPVFAHGLCSNDRDLDKFEARPVTPPRPQDSTQARRRRDEERTRPSATTQRQGQSIQRQRQSTAADEPLNVAAGEIYVYVNE
ncbi:hypothetical protein Z517_09377 [Fonsecaea pedrosoi CBS 271.37]|uniref:Unplaced genomic scaffold supercont1.6, whole genome shotgun sequence n=1 Tax=Fonsecaea pedrosoi CBS 271.37 TaxID=1442368 RepID=A0A0D2G8C8_9EURO|nr:uncharacterized protein Z517_09377 [Fonsecaea pedrosoi CBS 271.37]KIW76933.1 hypothetical protein Z517_09377 [Fonsecaea pedrosoi CBS 271.37]